MRLPPFLSPSPTLTENDVGRSLRLMIWEGVASGALISLGTGGFMAAYALALGANNTQVGLLAALPFMMQVMRIPAILAVERFRMRKSIAAPAIWIAHLIWVPVGAVPFLLDTPGAAAISLVIVLVAVRGLFSPVWITAWSSWVRDLVPRERLGSYHGQRLAIITTSVAAVGLGSSFFVRWWESNSSPEAAIFAYSILLIGGFVVFGLASSTLISLAREPLMPAAAESDRSIVEVLTEPFRDRNFSHLVRFLFAWNFASSLAIPFFAVYMLSELGLALPVVIGFTALSQATNVLFVRVWGPMADRAGSKAVMSLSASLYLLVILGWIFTAYPERHALTLPLLGVLHAFAGIAMAGVTLTLNTIAFKVAPQGKATAFTGVASIAASVGGGIGPILGGFLADYFSVRTLRLDFSWIEPSNVVEFPALALTGFDFLFVIAFVLGLVSLNFLVALREEGEVPRDVALRELAANAGLAARAVSSVPGLGAVSSFSYGYLKRVPGADVAIGVTAYQLAASTQTAVASAARGRVMVRDLASAVGRAVGNAVEEMEDVAEHGIEIARHATRGALQAGNELTGEAGTLAQAAVFGTLSALAAQDVSYEDALLGAGYGVVQGAVEAGEDPAEATAQAVEAAREAAAELGMDGDEAVDRLASGALRAATAAGEDALTAVQDALPGDRGQGA